MTAGVTSAWPPIPPPASSRSSKPGNRALAHVEDRVKAVKQTGMGRFPSREFAINQVWPQLAITAADLIAWTQSILLDAGLAQARRSSGRNTTNNDHFWHTERRRLGEARGG